MVAMPAPLIVEATVSGAASDVVVSVTAGADPPAVTVMWRVTMGPLAWVGAPAGAIGAALEYAAGSGAVALEFDVVGPVAVPLQFPSWQPAPQ